MSPNNQKQTLIPAILIIIFCLLFEWPDYIEQYNLGPLNIFKFLSPLVLLLLLIKRAPDFAPFKEYNIFFCVFMVWAIIPCLLSGSIDVTLPQWLKYLPRLLFCYVVSAYLFSRFKLVIMLMKILVVIAVLSLFQYVILEMRLTNFVLPSVSARGVDFFGPLGLLGNASNFSGLQLGGFIIYRLAGFWTEPSPASGFLFMAFFLAQALYIHTKKKKWIYASIACFAGGMCALSNAGYLGVTIALLFGLIYSLYHNVKYRWVLQLVVPAAGLILIVLFFARTLILQYFPESELLVGVFGVRGVTEGFTPSGVQFAGRDEWAALSWEIAKNNPLGIGFQIPGTNPEGQGFAEASPTAPLLWLAYTGFIGLVLLMLREAQVVRSYIWNSNTSSFNLRIFQAWIVLFMKNMAYGDLMTGTYFLIVAMIFSACYNNTPLLKHENNLGG